jgi:hypothetical protein
MERARFFAVLVERAADLSAAVLRMGLERLVFDLRTAAFLPAPGVVLRAPVFCGGEEGPGVPSLTIASASLRNSGFNPFRKSA